MGAGMARAMRRAGLDVTVWNRTRARAEPLAADGIAVADTVGQAVAGADVVLTMLFDTTSVLDVEAELLDALGPESVWLQSATVGVEGIRRIAEQAGAAALLDAPVLGTKQPAEQGRLVPLVSGAAAHIDRARPVLDAIGARTVVAGSRIGDASALKLAANAWVLSITAATAQSLALTQALDLDPKLFLQAIAGGPADSAYAQLKGAMMLAGDFAPSFGIDAGRKDLALIAAAAANAGVDEALLTGVIALFDAASKAGHGEDDLAAVYTALSPE